MANVQLNIYGSAFREFSPEKRMMLAKEGTAMDDGSYPIVTKADLQNAIQAFGRSKNPEATKKHIIKRAKALGSETMLPESWMSRNPMPKAASETYLKDLLG